MLQRKANRKNAVVAPRASGSVVRGSVSAATAVNTLTGGLLEWSGRGEPLRIPVCRRCRDRLEGQLPRWGEVQSNGVWCPVQTARPCADCLSESAPHRTQRGLFRRLLGG